MLARSPVVMAASTQRPVASPSPFHITADTNRNSPIHHDMVRHCQQSAAPASSVSNKRRFAFICCSFAVNRLLLLQQLGGRGKGNQYPQSPDNEGHNGGANINGDQYPQGSINGDPNGGGFPGSIGTGAQPGQSPQSPAPIGNGGGSGATANGAHGSSYPSPHGGGKGKGTE